MPNRYVRESAIDSERVNSLSWQGEVFYRRLINRVDDFGRFTAHPELLRSTLFPLQLSKVSGADIARLLLECERSGLVSTYKSVDGKQYLAMHRWELGRAKSSKYPEPPPDVKERLYARVNGCLHMQAYVPDSDPDPDTEGKRARGAPPCKDKLKGAELIVADKEVGRIEKRIATILNGYDSHQSLSPEHGAELKKLRARRMTLKDRMGVEV